MRVLRLVRTPKGVSGGATTDNVSVVTIHSYSEKGNSTLGIELRSFFYFICIVTLSNYFLIDLRWLSVTL